MMSDDEIAKLSEDIATHGLQRPIVLWRASDDSDATTICVLDGRNRLAALERLGVRWLDLGDVQWPNHDGEVSRIAEFNYSADPAAYVISANIHRRHLTKAQQAELIVRTIEAGKIDRAKVARSFSPIAGRKGGSTKDPDLAAAVAEAKKHDISKRLIQEARAKVVAEDHTSAEQPREGEPARARSTKAGEGSRARWRPTYAFRARPRVSGARRGERVLHRESALELIAVGFKTQAARLHPDRGGSTEAMTRLNRVRDVLNRIVRKTNFV
jgi:hypothetical protein